MSLAVADTRVRARRDAGAEPAARPALRRWTPWRRTTQVAVALFYVALPAAAAAWGVTAVAGTLAALQLGPVDLVEPAGAASAALAAGTAGATLLLGVLPVVLLALALGPVYCSWVCPWGLVSEGLDALRGRVRRRVRRVRPSTRPRRWPADAFLRLRGPRIAVLAGVLAASVLLATPLAAWLSAPRLITSLPLELIVLGSLSAVTGGLLLALLAFELLGPRRLWCRALCPVGSAAKLLRTPRTLTVRYHETRCTCPSTPLCQHRCPWGVDPRRMRLLDGCTTCMRCVDGCPGEALSAGFGRLRPARARHHGSVPVSPFPRRSP